MKKGINVFSTTWAVILVGLVIGTLVPFLQKKGNPPNMGICVACFERDTAGALGLHQAKLVQYVRPEIIGLVLGSLLAALMFREFRPRAGSSPIIRFTLGMFAMIGALVFLGCPWRALLRLSAGDGNAIFGLAGLIAGIWIATLFFRIGYDPGRSTGTHAFAGWIFPLMMAGILMLRVIYRPIQGADSSGILFYSVKGPGSMHAPVISSLCIALLIGFLAQRSRFCTMGAFRDLILFGQPHLFWGVVALVVAAFVTNNVLGQFHPGFANQPIAHSAQVWNFTGMALAGLAFALAGGCPGRQLFMAGEGDGDAAIFVVGMFPGAAFSHDFGLAGSPTGPGAHSLIALVIGFIVCGIIGFTMRQATVGEQI